MKVRPRGRNYNHSAQAEVGTLLPSSRQHGERLRLRVPYSLCPSHSFCHCSVALARPSSVEGEWPSFTGDFVYKQGRLDLARGLQLARLSKCVVPDSELQGQLEQTNRRAGSI